jgi:hypothetical protein
MIPKPTDAVLIRLAAIAARADEVLAPDNPLDRPRVGLSTAKNDRRRAMEKILVLLADPEVRTYVADLKERGLLNING